MSNVLGDDLLNSMNGTSSASSVTTDSVKEAEDRFLKLLIAQLQNQDPLNPLDNAQVTSQMAQLSTVTGINRLNDTLDLLMSSLSSNQSLEAAAMIGHGVLVSGNSTVLSKAEDMEVDGEVVPGASLSIFGIDLKSNASNVAVNVYDLSGALVQTINVGAADAGVIPLSWDGSTLTGGTADPGKYTFTVDATMNGQPVSASTLSFGEVMSVTKGADNTVSLNVLTIGSVSLSDIRQIL